jgi:hypothetical protein
MPAFDKLQRNRIHQKILILSDPDSQRRYFVLANSRVPVAFDVSFGQIQFCYHQNLIINAYHLVGYS